MLGSSNLSMRNGDASSSFVSLVMCVCLIELLSHQPLQIFPFMDEI